MRTAVVLLVLLALAAIPGSFLPQRGVASDPAAVPNFVADHPGIAPWLDRLSLFDVYSAPWFAAIYVLLLVSMTGCVVPRCAKLWREYRQAPPAAPRRLERETDHALVPLEPTPGSRSAALDRAEAELRRRHFVVVRTDTEVRAERGRVRELGNLGFHLSLLVLLVGIAGGRLYGYEGRAVVIEGGTFTNAVASYDALTPAPWMDVDDLTPLSFTLDDFDAAFEATGARAGEPRNFEARLSWATEDGSGTADVRPNTPFEVDGTKFFLTGHGYAPTLTVRDPDGTVVSSGPTVFLPRDSFFTSDGVVKAPDARPAGLGVEAVFHPTAAPTDDGLVSVFPDLLVPRVELTAWRGDLGLDSGLPQSVYTLDTTLMSPVTDASGERWEAMIGPGETATLPDGSTVTFDRVDRFANFQIARDPGKEISLAAALLLLTGLTVSLGVPRRRVWARLTADGTALEVAGRALARRGMPAGEVSNVALAAGAGTRLETTSIATEELPR